MNIDLYCTSANTAYQRLVATFRVSIVGVSTNAALTFFAAPAAVSGRALISLMVIAVALFTMLSLPTSRRS